MEPPHDEAIRDEAVLLELLRVARRRHRMLPLPHELGAAVAAGSAVTLAFTLEAARRAMAEGAIPPAALRDAFVGALGALLRRAAAPGRGDPLFQAQLLRACDPQVRAWARLEVLAARDAREVRSVVDAIAHPGKLRGMPDGPRRRALATLHAHSVASEWEALASEALSLLPSLEEGEERLRAGLHRLSASDAVQRLGRQAALSRLEAVQAYRTLRARREASAGSDAALGQGRAAAREGLRAEDAAAYALGEVATLLNAVGPGAYRVWRSLLTPPGLATGAERAKTEWDAAIVRQAEAGTHDVILLAEAKAAPAAAAADLSRLLRGLALLAQAQADASYVFAAAGGAVRIGGASLRALQPEGAALPRQVVYVCPAPQENRPAMLDPAARATLMSQPASLRFAAACMAGASPADDALVPVWEGVTQAPRLRAVLHQYDTACRTREAMLHPDDLSAAVAELRATMSRPARQP